MDEQAQGAPSHRWERFGLRWEYKCRRPLGQRWGVSDACCGVEAQRDPVRAYLALRRWRNSPSQPWPSPDTEGGAEG